MKRIVIVGAVSVCLAFFSVFSVGCKDAGEDVGGSVDDAVEKTGDAAQDAYDWTEEKTEDAVEKTGDAAQDAYDWTEEKITD